MNNSSCFMAVNSWWLIQNQGKVLYFITNLGFYIEERSELILKLCTSQDTTLVILIGILPRRGPELEWQRYLQVIAKCSAEQGIVVQQKALATLLVSFPSWALYSQGRKITPKKPDWPCSYQRIKHIQWLYLLIVLIQSQIFSCGDKS